eukprot:SAG25_NODE_273_length_10590_cov_137.207968_1_plen_176_part_00
MPWAPHNDVQRNCSEQGRGLMEGWEWLPRRLQVTLEPRLCEACPAPFVSLEVTAELGDSGVDSSAGIGQSAGRYHRRRHHSINSAPGAGHHPLQVQPPRLSCAAAGADGVAQWSTGASAGRITLGLARQAHAASSASGSPAPWVDALGPHRYLELELSEPQQGSGHGRWAGLFRG